MTGSPLDPAPAMLAASRSIIVDHREITAVLTTSAAFLTGVLALVALAV